MAWEFRDANGVLRAKADDVAHRMMEWAADGTLIRNEPYTPEEEAALAEWQATQTALTNELTLKERALQALDTNNTFLALTAPTNVQVLAQVKALTRQMNALIRLAGNALDDITDT